MKILDHDTDQKEKECFDEAIIYSWLKGRWQQVNKSNLGRTITNNGQLRELGKELKKAEKLLKGYIQYDGTSTFH